MTSLGDMVQGVAKLALRHPNKHIIRTLSKESDVLEQQRQSFVTISQGFPIACMFEELPTAGGMVSTYTGSLREVTKEVCRLSQSRQPAWTVGKLAGLAS